MGDIVIDLNDFRRASTAVHHILQMAVAEPSDPAISQLLVSTDETTSNRVSHHLQGSAPGKKTRNSRES
jgi:hypothetical protein